MSGGPPVNEDRHEQAVGVHALLRAFDLLDVLTDCERSMGLSELVAKSGVSMATTHRLLKTLEADGYIRQHGDRSYSLGPRLIELGRTASTLLPSWTERYLRELVERTGDTANLAVLDADEVVYVAQARSQMGLQMTIPIGARLPAHCTAVGKSLLSALPDSYVESVLVRTGMPSRTANTVTDPAELLRQLSRVRDSGFATDVGEQEDGLSCVAVPVRPAPRNMAISVSGPTERLTEERHKELAAILTDVAHGVVAELRRGAVSFNDQNAASSLARRGRRKLVGD